MSFSNNPAPSVYVVTGAASGLGLSVTKKLLESGAVVYGIDRAALPAELCLHKSFRPFQLDLTNAASVDAVFDQFMNDDNLSGVIHCAGVLHTELLSSSEGKRHKVASFKEVIDSNLFSTFYIARAASAAMSANASSRTRDRSIIFVGSVSGEDGQIGQCAYAASKGAVAAMTLPLARELARFGIRVVTIAPGMFDTPMVQSLPDRVQKSLESQIPHPPRFGVPDEFADFVISILKNTYINGSVLRIDGSVRLSPG